MTFLTKQQMIDSVMKDLDEAVKDFPEEEREEAKARLLESWGLSMFYSGGPRKEKNT